MATPGISRAPRASTRACSQSLERRAGSQVLGHGAGMGLLVMMAQPQRDAIGGAADDRHVVRLKIMPRLRQAGTATAEPWRLTGKLHFHIAATRQRAQRARRRPLEAFYR